MPKQRLLQKVFILPLLVVSLALSTLVIVPTTFADDYPVPANGQCNGSDTKVNVDGKEMCRTATTTTPPAGQGEEKTESEDDITCAIEKLGWILCPVIETSSKIGDQAFQFLAKNFLETEPELVASGNRSGTYIAWELARNIANILFIAAFLIIILSQVTGRGLDNYGIKKLLPKLIIAAIAVNVSYYICQLMVDLTNIIGYEIQNFMVDTARQVTHSVVMPPQMGAMDNQTSDGTLGKIAAGALGVAAVVWFLLPMIFLGVSTVVITCLVIIAILLMRKAFIVLLVVASPIAFVAYLLPNTEKYFQKWLNMFWQLLLVFPIVGLLFGAGQLASAIVLVAGTSTQTDTQVAEKSTKSVYSDTGEKCVQVPKVNNDGKVTSGAEVKPCGDGSTPFMLGLVAAGVAVAPMLAVWAVLKGALSAAGAIGGKIAGAVQSAGDKGGRLGKAGEAAMRKAAFQKYQTAALKNGAWVPGGSLVRANHRRGLKKDQRESALEAAKAGATVGDAKNLAIAQQTATNKIAANSINQAVQYGAGGKNGIQAALGAGGQADAMAKALSAAAAKEAAERIKEIEFDMSTSSIGELQHALSTTTDTQQAKAIQNLLLSRGSAGINGFHNAVGSMGPSEVTRALQENITANHGDIGSSDKAILDWAGAGGRSLSSVSGDASTWAGLTAAKFAGMSGGAQGRAADAMSSTELARLTQDLRANSNDLAKVATDVRSRHSI